MSAGRAESSRFTEHGIDRLRVLVRQAPMRRWVLCMLSSREEAQTIEAEGSALLGADQILVTEPCTHDMTEPEIAFVIEADDDVTACREAAARMATLRQRLAVARAPRLSGRSSSGPTRPSKLRSPYRGATVHHIWIEKVLLARGRLLQRLDAAGGLP